jgi:hypothetical protein
MSPHDVAEAIRECASNDPLGAFSAILGGADFVRRGPLEQATFCPWHDDHHESFRINIEKALAYCDPCGRGGDIFATYAALHDLNTQSDFPRVCDELGALLGIASPGRSPTYRGPRTRSRRPSAHERLVAEIAQSPAPTPLPECCLRRDGQCGHWAEFDREYLIANLRGNLATAIGELHAKAARGVRFDLEPRRPDLPLEADELIAGIRFAISFGAIVPAGIPDFVVDRAITEAIDSSLSGEADHAT